MGEIVEARHIAMYVAHGCGVSCSDIAKAFRRNRATVLHAIRKVQNYWQHEELIRQYIGQLTARVRLPESAVPAEFTEGPCRGVIVDSRSPVIVALLSASGSTHGERPYIRLAWCGEILQPSAVVTQYSLVQSRCQVGITFHTLHALTGFDEVTSVYAEHCVVERTPEGQVVCCSVDGTLYEEMIEKLFSGFDTLRTPRSVADKPGVFLKQ